MKIDELVEMTLMEMIDYPLTPSVDTVCQFAREHLNVSLTRQEVEDALQRRLSCALSLYDDVNCPAGFQQFQEAELRQVFQNHQYAYHPIAEKEKWGNYPYPFLEEVHRILQKYGSPDLLYEVDDEEEESEIIEE